MLHRKTVSEELFKSLRQIMKSDVFSDFRLVGGTALALQIGHRNSVDIDLFGNREINVDRFVSELEDLGNVEVLTSNKSIVICYLDGVKIDIVNHKYAFLDDAITIQGIRMATKRDISAMKLHAIEQRGTRKDFIDLFFLLNDFSLQEMYDFYLKKYENHIPFMMLQSLTHFYDAEKFPIPKMYMDFDWSYCKEKIGEEHSKFRL